MLNIGYRQGVEKGMQFSALKETEILNDAGEPIAMDETVVASLRVIEVREGFSYAEVIERMEELPSGMKVSSVKM